VSSVPALEPTLMNEINTAVIARLDRSTQYSRDGRFQPRSRGVRDRPVKSGDDSLVVAGGSFAMTAREFRFEFQTADTRPHSRGTVCPRFAFRCPSKEGAGNAGCALHPRSRVQSCAKGAHTNIQVQRRHSDIPCAMALRLIPCSPRSIGLSCLRRLTETGASARSGFPHLRKT
jgi:hypothetical protein